MMEDECVIRGRWWCLKGGGVEEAPYLPAWLCSFTSHGFLQKLSTLVKLICLLFYEHAFHSPDFVPLSNGFHSPVTQFVSLDLASEKAD